MIKRLYKQLDELEYEYALAAVCVETWEEYELAYELYEEIQELEERIRAVMESNNK